jgi:hypothetical protein
MHFQSIHFSETTTSALDLGFSVITFSKSIDTPVCASIAYGERESRLLTVLPG